MADLLVRSPCAGVRLLVMSRGAKRNAISFGLIDALREELRIAEADGIRALVIAGEGPVFSAGADFSGLKADPSDLAFDDAMSQLTTALVQSPVVSFAAIQGACIGAALDLALACDFRVAAPGASFSLPAARMGILYNPRRLAEVLPIMSAAIARRLLLLAETVNCEDARAGGIVTHLCEQDAAEAVLAAALGHAARAVALPAQAQRAAKEFIAAVRQADYQDAAWQPLRLALLASDDRKAALMQKRTPGK